MTTDRPLAVGDAVTFLDGRNRVYRAVLKAGKTTRVRGQVLEHDAAIGGPPGLEVTSSKGERFWVVRATVEEWVPSMPRYATVIYPKDLGALLIHGDVFPGARVLEAGLGSGGLALALLRAVGPTGCVISYERQPAARRQAKANIKEFYRGREEHRGEHVIRDRDVYAGIEEEPLDRLFLDVPEPWQVVPHAVEALRGGGVFASYSPSITQSAELTKALRGARAFAGVATLEVLERRWYVGQRSLRPEHEMVGHTGFLTIARRVFRSPPPDAAD